MPTADEVVVEFEARVGQYEADLKRAARTFETTTTAQSTQMARMAQQVAGSAAQIGGSMRSVERSFGLAGAASRNLGYQISDISTQLASGTSPFLILAQQGPQVANALDGAGGAVGRFAGFLSSWQGALLLAAGTLAAQLIPKLLETGDSVDSLVEKLKEHAKQAALNDQAEALFARSLEGVEKAAKTAKDAVEALRLVKKGEAEQTVESIKKNLDLAESIRGTTRARLADARALYEAQKQRSRGSGTGSDLAQIGLADNIASITRLEGELTRADAAANSLRQSYDRAVSARTVAETNVSAEEAINRKYDLQIDRAAAAANASKKAQDALKAEIVRINQARDAELERYRKAEEARRKAERGTGQGAGEPTPFINPVGSGRVTGNFGEQRPGHTHAGIDIAVPVGTPVKAAAAGTVIEAGTLPGYGNVVIIDHGAGTITRYAHLSALSAKRGEAVTQGEVIGQSGGARGAPGSGNSQGPHLHYEVRQNGRPVDPRKGTYAADTLGAQAKSIDDLQRQAQEELQRRRTFEAELATMQGGEINARRSLVVASEALAKLETQAIEISRQKYNANLDSLVKEGKLHADEAEQLRQINDTQAALRTELVKRQEAERQFRIQEEAAQEKLKFQSDNAAAEEDLLRSQQGIATTARERRELGERLIDIQFDQEKIELQAVIAGAERLKIEMDRLATLRELSDAEKQQLARAQDEAAVAQGRLGTLDQRKANAQKGNDRQNASPVQDFLNSVPQSADEINAALEGVAANGLNDLVNGLADAAMGFKSLGDVARGIVQMMLGELIKLIAKMLILKLLKTVLGLSGGGEVGGKAAGGMVRRAMGGAIPGFADGGIGGGLLKGPGTGLSDSIHAMSSSGPLMVADGEYIVRASSVRSLGAPVLNYLNQFGRLPPQARGFAGGGLPTLAMPSGSPVSAGGGTVTADPAFKAMIRGAIAEASKIMPPVNLYPTMDPGAVLRQALSSPGGRRAMFEFTSANAGRFKKSLG